MGKRKKKGIDAAVTKAMSEMQLNTNSATMNEGIRGRIASLMSGGYDFADTLHNIYLDFGYPTTLEFSHYWNMYRRFGIAKSIVELPTDTGWSSPPIIEGDKRFNAELEKLINQYKLFVRLKGLDTRQRVGRYAGMFMRVKDGKEPSEAIDDTFPGLGALVEMMPLYESQLKVTESDNDPKSETYGQPIMYQYSGSAAGGRNAEAVNTISIHASRVVIAAEGADNGWIYGISSLEAPYNSLMDLRKIAGAGGEGFYKNAAQSIVFDLKETSSAVENKDLLDKFSENYDEFAQNRSRRAIWTPGMEAKTLDSTLANPKEYFMNSLSDVAAASKIPASIIVRQQVGQLASVEDTKNFLSGVQSRRENFMTDMISDVIDWCIKFGILPASQYEVTWDDLLARSEDEKLANSDKMASINERQFKSGGDVPFTGEEIREAAGFNPEEMEDIGSEEIEDEEDD